MDRELLRERVAAARVGRLATAGADGRPHAVPLCFVLLDDSVYSAVDHKPKRGPRLRRLRHIEETGRACLLVDEYAEDWSALWWIRLDGPARLVRDAGESGRAFAALIRKYPQYVRQPPTGEVLAIDVDAWTWWSAAAP